MLRPCTDSHQACNGVCNMSVELSIRCIGTPSYVHGQLYCWLHCCWTVPRFFWLSRLQDAFWSFRVCSVGYVVLPHSSVVHHTVGTSRSVGAGPAQPTCCVHRTPQQFAWSSAALDAGTGWVTQHHMACLGQSHFLRVSSCRFGWFASLNRECFGMRCQCSLWTLVGMQVFVCHGMFPVSAFCSVIR